MREGCQRTAITPAGQECLSLQTGRQLRKKLDWRMDSCQVGISNPIGRPVRTCLHVYAIDGTIFIKHPLDLPGVCVILKIAAEDWSVSVHLVSSAHARSLSMGGAGRVWQCRTPRMLRPQLTSKPCGKARTNLLSVGGNPASPNQKGVKLQTPRESQGTSSGGQESSSQVLALRNLMQYRPSSLSKVCCEAESGGSSAQPGQSSCAGGQQQAPSLGIEDVIHQPCRNLRSLTC